MYSSINYGECLANKWQSISFKCLLYFALKLHCFCIFYETFLILDKSKKISKKRIIWMTTLFYNSISNVDWYYESKNHLSMGQSRPLNFIFVFCSIDSYENWFGRKLESILGELEQVCTLTTDHHHHCPYASNLRMLQVDL